jgi:hypothetical protein
MTLVEEFIFNTVQKAEKPVSLIDLLFTRGPQTFTSDAIRVAVWKLIDEEILELGKDNKIKIKG